MMRINLFFGLIGLLEMINGLLNLVYTANTILDKTTAILCITLGSISYTIGYIYNELDKDFIPTLY